MKILIHCGPFGSTFKMTHNKKKKKMRKAVKGNIYFLTRRHEEPDERAVCLEEEDVGSWTSETPEQDASGMCQSCA